MFYQVKLNDKLLNEYCVVENVRRPLFSTINNTLVKIPGKPGQMLVNNETGSKITEIDIRLIKKDRLEVMKVLEDLKPLILFKDLRKLEVDDMPGKYEEVILDGDIDFEKFSNTGFTTLTFLNPSGLFYGKDKKTGTNNKGNTDTPWILKGNYTSGAIKISNQKTLETIVVDMSKYSSGAKVEIDFEKELIKINGTIDMKRLYYESDFWYLSPGENPYSAQGLENVETYHFERWS